MKKSFLLFAVMISLSACFGLNSTKISELVNYTNSELDAKFKNYSTEEQNKIGAAMMACAFTGEKTYCNMTIGKALRYDWSKVK